MTPSQMSFDCPVCTEEIFVPGNLPPTEAPCPYCDNLIISPDWAGQGQPVQRYQQEAHANVGAPPLTTPSQPPVAPSNQSWEPLKVTKNDLETSRSAPTMESGGLPDTSDSLTQKNHPVGVITAPVPSKQQVESGTVSYAPVSGPTPNPMPQEQPTFHPVRAKKRRLLPFIAGLLGIVAFCLVTLVVLKRFGILKPELLEDLKARVAALSGDAPEASKLDPWRIEANRLLQAFLSAPTVERRMPLVLQTPGVEDRMRSFYALETSKASQIPVSAYKRFQLSAADEGRGIYLMGSDATGADGRPLISRVFFKDSETGMRLDWDVFSQTRFQTFQSFVNGNETGEGRLSQILRAEIMQIPSDNPSDAKAGVVSYRINDPFYRAQSVVVRLSQDSPIGGYLSEINWIGVPGRTQPSVGKLGTVELSRVQVGEREVIVLNRFICWEFFGLGNTTDASIVNPLP